MVYLYIKVPSCIIIRYQMSSRQVAIKRRTNPRALATDRHHGAGCTTSAVPSLRKGGGRREERGQLENRLEKTAKNAD